MTNEDKADLRIYVRRLPSDDDARIAMLCGCTVATVKKYRAAVPGAKP